MSKLVHSVYFFFPGDAAKLTGVHRSTINRWLHSGKISGRQLPNTLWIVSLDGVNQGRAMYGLPPMTEEDADRYYETGEIKL